jgi:hypothetical protein
MISRKIWIPSKQLYRRFRELSVSQYMDIARSLDDIDDFRITIIDILGDNILGDNDILTYTMLDLLVVILYTKIYSCGAHLELSRKCDKCGTITKIVKDLNILLDELAPFIDKSFKKRFYGSYAEVECDIPTLNETLEKREKLDEYMYTFIKKVHFDTPSGWKTTTDINDKTMRLVPLDMMLKIQSTYIDQLFTLLGNIMLFEMNCSNELCSDKLSIKCDINDLMDVIRLVFRDDNINNILSVLANVSSQVHLDYNFYKNLTPLELDSIVAMLSKSEESQNAPQTDMFSNDLQETPSEFK